MSNMRKGTAWHREVWKDFALVPVERPWMVPLLVERDLWSFSGTCDYLAFLR